MQQVWQDTQRRIRGQLNPRIWEQFFSQLELREWNEDRVTLELPDEFTIQWFDNHYRDFVAEVLKDVGGKQVDIDLQVRQARPVELSSKTAAARVEAAPTRSLEQRAVESRLNVRYTFENFVAGPSNEFCHAACRAAAERPGELYNPIFIHGGVGLGKTHLLHAVGLEILQTRPDLKVTYVTSEEFMNDLVYAIRTNDTIPFRERYREDCDVLLMDDVQFVAGKSSTENELFHTFNDLHQAGKQIIFTSDKMPQEVPGLEERLRSRFGWGLIADIQPPEIETRMAIVNKKAEQERVHLPNEVALFLATHIRSNVRELEGALVRLKAYAALSKKTIDLDLARTQLKGLIRDTPSTTSIDQIQSAVAEYFGVTIAELMGRRRHRAIAHPRHVAMYLCRKLTKHSYPDIGRAFGGRDHSTVMNGFSKVEKALLKDEELHRKVQELERRLVG